MIPVRRRPVNRGNKVTGFTVPAPIGGWNTQDPLAAMPPADAVILDNFYPNGSEVRLRSGHAEHATGLGDQVQTLAVYTNGTTSSMWGFAGGSLFNVSATGAVGAAAVTGLSNAKWQGVNHGTTGGRFWIGVNGADAARIYDGSSWGTSPAISGVSSSALVCVTSHIGRLFFGEKDKLKFWYLAADAIGGAASGFDVGAFCRKGGYVQALASWTRDGGAGPDDLFVIVTSEGEVLIYSGTDPSSASTWALQGRFSIAKPIGRRCVHQVGGDVLISTVAGVIPLSVVLSGKDEAQLPELALTKKINRAVADAAALYSTSFGWELATYDRRKWLILNVPVAEGERAEQFVMSLGGNVGAWCRFKNLNANCWAEFNGSLYFGGDEIVYQADTGEDDNGSDISGICMPAYSYMGAPGVRKAFRHARPVGVASGTVLYRMQFSVDFDDQAPSSTPSSTESAGTEWDEGDWDTFFWADGERPFKDWTSISGEGYAASPRVSVATQNMTIALQMFNIIYEPAGLM